MYDLNHSSAQSERPNDSDNRSKKDGVTDGVKRSTDVKESQQSNVAIIDRFVDVRKDFQQSRLS